MPARRLPLEHNSRTPRTYSPDYSNKKDRQRTPLNFSPSDRKVCSSARCVVSPHTLRLEASQSHMMSQVLTPLASTSSC
eukprot:3619001-Amphidinium_carterae.1